MEHFADTPADPTVLADIIENFEFLDDWEDRYRYLIELGRTLAPLPDGAHNEINRVRGCASQVWLQTRVVRDAQGRPTLHFLGDSDAHIVRGLVALTLAIFSGKSAETIATTDALAIFDRLGLGAHLTPQRSNGLRSMVERIKSDARASLQQAWTQPGSMLGLKSSVAQRRSLPEFGPVACEASP